MSTFDLYATFFRFGYEVEQGLFSSSSFNETAGE